MLETNTTKTKREILSSLRPKGAYDHLDVQRYVELSASKVRVALLKKTAEYTLPIFNLIEDKDSSVGAEIEKRQNSLLNKPYTHSLSDDYEESYEEIMKASLEARLFGVAVVELHLDENNNFAFSHVERQYFRSCENDIFLKSKTKKEFKAKEPRYFVLYHKATLLKLMWVVFAKHYVLSHYMKFTEFLGVPPLIANAHSSDDNVIDQITEALKNIKSGSYAVLGKEDIVKVLEGKGTQADFMVFVKYVDAEIAKVINGSVLTSNISIAGSYAQSQTHEENRYEIVAGDIKYASRTVNKLFKKIGLQPKFKIPIKKNKDMLNRAQTLQILDNMGVPISHDQISDEFGIKLTANNKSFKSKNAKTNDISLDAIDASVNSADFSNEEAEILNVVNELFDNVNSYEELYEKIVDLFPDINLEMLEHTLLNVIASSQMNGYSK